MSWCEQIKEVLTMREVLEKYLGAPNYAGKYLCPFHGDKHPSLSINNRTNKFKCFACGESGDVVDFAEKYFQLSQKEALLTLSNDFHLNIGNEFISREEVERKKREREEKRRRKEDIQRRCKALKKDIFVTLSVVRDIYIRNRPRKNEDFEAFTYTKRPNRCIWAAYQEAYCLYLLDCLDCVPYTPYYEACENGMSFDLYILNRLPTDFDNGCSQTLLSKRMVTIIEKLEKGEIERLWQFRANTTISA